MFWSMALTHASPISNRDTVIVLHMMGSHGPAYWKRYPESYETFTPACKVAQFSHCELKDIINAYDNSIVYTDHVLARLIQVLSGAASHDVDAGMLYVSDHGESLGEHNMYLHGMPYAIAPEAQIHVPMVVWLSPSMRESTGIDHGCLVKRTSERVEPRQSLSLRAWSHGCEDPCLRSVARSFCGLPQISVVILQGSESATR